MYNRLFGGNQPCRLVSARFVIFPRALGKPQKLIDWLYICIFKLHLYRLIKKIEILENHGITEKHKKVKRKGKLLC